jgi:hypothetical protein
LRSSRDFETYTTFDIVASCLPFLEKGGPLSCRRRLLIVLNLNWPFAPGAGIAMATGATLATRNTALFADLSVPVIDPWTA